MNVDIKIWLRLLGDGNYRMITNPDMVQEGDIQVAMPFSYEEPE